MAHAYLGVELAPLTPDFAHSLDTGLRAAAAEREPPRDGVVVRNVVPGAPADLGGVESLDIIVAVDDTPVRSVSQALLPAF